MTTKTPTHINPLIAERLILLRKRSKLTQNELAQKTGLERKTIIRYETGQHIPSGKALSNLARIFGVTTDYLLGLTNTQFPLPRSESDLTPLELQAIQLLRRAGTDVERQRLLEALETLTTQEPD